MISIIDKKDCTGCTACYNGCPVKAIHMVQDKEGFFYPSIDQNICIHCEKCVKICPVRNKTSLDCQEIPLEAYVTRNQNENILLESSSGGFFSVISEYVFSQGGIVYGACFNEDMQVSHESAVCMQEAGKFRTSKYVQSSLGDVFTSIKNFLEQGKLVCFSGTPCQVSGLKSYLGKEYDKLITLDVVCHGVPSPLLWKSYIEWLQKTVKSEITGVNFRKKTYGYHSGILEVVFENGKKYYGSMRNDMMIKSFFKEISSRPSCYDCKFKTARHNCDFTIFDCWHACELTNLTVDDDKGYTNLFVQSAKGTYILKQLHESIELYPCHAEEAIRYDGKMVRKSAIPHKNRDDFYKALNQYSLEKAVQMYIPIKKTDKLIVSFRRLFYHVGLLNQARKILKWLGL